MLSFATKYPFVKTNDDELCTRHKSAGSTVTMVYIANFK